MFLDRVARSTRDRPFFFFSTKRYNHEQFVRPFTICPKSVFTRTTKTENSRVNVTDYCNAFCNKTDAYLFANLALFKPPPPGSRRVVVTTVTPCDVSKYRVRGGGCRNQTRIKLAFPLPSLSTRTINNISRNILRNRSPDIEIQLNVTRYKIHAIYTN